MLIRGKKEAEGRGSIANTTGFIVPRLCFFFPKAHHKSGIRRAATKIDLSADSAQKVGVTLVLGVEEEEPYQTSFPPRLVFCEEKKEKKQ